MLASLPMYDLAEVRHATEDWWAAIAHHAGIDGAAVRFEQPATLMEHWTSPDLLFSQTCGYPLTHGLEGRVRYLATPCYAAPGCEGALYRSAILVRDGAPMATLADAQDARLAINGHDSQSGCNVLRVMAAETSEQRPFFGHVRVTHGHVASIMAVQDGMADLAAIDCVTLALLRKHRPAALEGLRIMAWSPASPGLPYVTGLQQPDEIRARLLRGLRLASVDARLAPVRSQLLIEGVSALNLAAYAVIPGMRRRAEALGLDELSLVS